MLSLAEDWKKRTPVANCIIFGFARAKTLQGLMHWVQDMQRTKKDPATQHFTQRWIMQLFVKIWRITWTQRPKRPILGS